MANASAPPEGARRVMSGSNEEGGRTARLRGIEGRDGAERRFRVHGRARYGGREQDRKIGNARKRGRVPEEIAVTAFLEAAVGVAAVFVAMVVRGPFVAAHRMLHDAGVRAAPDRPQLGNGRHDRDEQNRREREKGDATMSDSISHDSEHPANGPGWRSGSTKRNSNSGAG
ncbi:MAG TPA: hypothetical protein VHE32_02050 [Rhodanobacteraceae bacterium]|nr:hypothetical protein [Rhodanobacteraceae bacterium]